MRQVIQKCIKDLCCIKELLITVVAGTIVMQVVGIIQHCAVRVVQGEPHVRRKDCRSRLVESSME
jgi:hypothetical protein